MFKTHNLLLYIYIFILEKIEKYELVMLMY